MKLIEVYIKSITGERIDLDSVFMQNVAKKNRLQYFNIDLDYNKKYYIKNVPFCLLIDLGINGLREYMIKIIDDFNIPGGIFDYEKWLLE